MKIFKRILWGLLSIVILLVVGVYLYVESLKPVYNGTIKIDGLTNTEVYFDTIGVPHIFAETEQNAMVALGYVHAQERLWQMELLRRIAAGRLAEILGEDLVEVDVFFSSLGIDETVNKQVQALAKNPKVQKLVAAYLKGVNAYIDTGKTPVEFTLLGIDKEHYTTKDMYYVTAYMAFNFAHAFKVDPLLTYIQTTYGNEYLKDLAIDVDARTVYQENYDARTQKALASVTTLLKKLPFPQFIGSNAWVVAPQKTTTGKVLFENDPHIGYAQPSVWYQAHIKTPKYERYGFHLGLMPFPLLSHNRDYAFGLTMFENDDMNFYTLKKHPTDSTKYEISTGIHTYDYVNKVIKIKGGTEKKIQIKKSILGPVFNSQLKTLDSVNPIAVQWVFNEKPNTVLQTSYGINHAKNVYDFENQLRGFSAPGLNFVYGDKENNIALWSVGQLYRFKDPVNTRFVLNGMDSIHTEKTWVNFDKNPKAINPPKGYLVTSNTQPAAVDGELYQGYYLSEDRGVAIHKELEKNEKIGMSDMLSLATSHTSPVVLNNIKAIVKGIDIEKLSPYELLVLDRLIKWKGNHGLLNVGPTIYNKLNFKLLKHTFKDEFGATFFKDYVDSHLSKRTQNKYIYNTTSVWWDDITTDEKETFETIVMKSFKESVAELTSQLGDKVDEWHWKKVHTVTHEHALAKIDLLKKLLNVAETPITGGNETINNTMFDYTENGLYKSNAGPSARRIIDFSDVENSYAVVPTGQSGVFKSPYYSNQANYYNSGRYFKMLINEEEIKKSKNKLVFK
ncbi:penicillin acylase family protein [Wenyingzhuangia aestuarii]|uniref:penicillin acylase family protein n=1 Tax=Wenyingzhuangia aestuarii TaxID=1647582 RepID=UPI001439BB4A|nr:penicillin acylase family protein [Wenyingzhuangia aestuarii]NJB83074.1 penicillin amidase [Wenyingzhuangia aestuarii]